MNIKVLLIPLLVSIASTSSLQLPKCSLCHHHTTFRSISLLDPTRLNAGKEETELENCDGEDFSNSEKKLTNLELAWRSAKKPLLRIGNKGATSTHGNSLRQLLEAHTVVKVKINTGKLGSLEAAFMTLKRLAEQSGAAEGIEMIYVRDSEATIMFGQPGTTERISAGDFPPEKVPWVPGGLTLD